MTTKLRTPIVSIIFLAIVAAIWLMGMPKTFAHTGNITVKKSVCISANAMEATYVPTWSNGTESGDLSWKPGLVNDPGNWVTAGSVSGSSGSSEFTLTHPKSAFSGPSSSNGPWVSFRIVFSDNYTVTGDTRVEGFDWSKCVPEQPKDKVEIVYGDWTGEAPTCEMTPVTWTRTVTQITTPYIWDGSTNTWVLGEPEEMALDSETKTVTWDETHPACATDTPSAEPTPNPEDNPTPPAAQPIVVVPSESVATATPTPLPVVAAAPELANTGVSIRVWVFAGIAAVLIGTGLIIYTFASPRGRHRD